MKHYFLAIIVLLAATAQTATAQQSVCPKDVPTVKTGGKLNSFVLGNGSATSSTVIMRDNTVTQNTYYSKIDTVTNTGVDTLSQTIKSSVHTLYTWAYVNGYSGTSTSCTLTLQGSPDVTNPNSWINVYTATVTSGTKVYGYTFNSGNGMQFEGFRWVFTGVGTHASAWYAGMKAR